MDIDRSIRSGDKKVDDYIFALEEYLLSFDTSNIKKLIVAADLISGQIAEDLKLIALGSKGKGRLNILSEDKDDKIFDKVMKIIEKINSFKAVNDIVSEMKPKIKGEANDEKQIDAAAPKAELAPRAKRI